VSLPGFLLFPGDGITAKVWAIRFLDGDSSDRGGPKITKPVGERPGRVSGVPCSRWAAPARFFHKAFCGEHEGEGGRDESYARTVRVSGLAGLLGR